MTVYPPPSSCCTSTSSTSTGISAEVQAALDLKLGTTLPFLVRRPQQLPLKCAKQERMLLPSDTSWTTIVNLSGAGVVKRIWIATISHSAGYARFNRIRITANTGPGATPHVVGDSAGRTLEEFFGSVFTSGTFGWRNSRFGATGDHPDLLGYSAFATLPVPFQNGLKIEIQNVLGGNPEIWFFAEYVNNEPTNNWLLNFDWSLSNNIAPLAVHTMMNVSGKEVVLAGLHHYLSGGPSNWKALEGNYKIYYNGSPTADYESPGAEDFYGSSGYFQEGRWQNEETGLLHFTESAPLEFHGYRYFDENATPYGATGMKLTWDHGEAFMPPDGDIDSWAGVWYYTR